MFNFLENNWMEWYYNDDINQKFRKNSKDQFKLKIKKSLRDTQDLRSECVTACHSIRDTYPNEKLSVMFSGGSESEMIVRSFHAAQIPFTAYIGRYENDINIYDVSYAVIACESLGIDYKIIDFNVQKFFEDDAESYSLKSQIVIPPQLPQLALCDLVDGIPIMGGGELFLERADSDYNKKGTWFSTEWEYNWGWNKYFNYTGRPAIPDWCRWTPQLFYSWMNTQWFDNLINDRYKGKLGISSTKMIGYREAWPELMARKKIHGLEKIESVMYNLTKHLIKLHHNESFGGIRYINKTDTLPVINGDLICNLEYYEAEKFKNIIKESIDYETSTLLL